MSRSIALTGMPGAGKSTVGAGVAARLGRTFVDVDDEIERALDKPISTIVHEAGVPYFREFEHQMIRKLTRYDDIVIGLGGGAVLRDDNVAEVLLTGVLVHIDVPVEEIVDRLTADSAEVEQRPLLAGDAVAALRQLHTERDARYRDVAEVSLDGSGTPDEVVDRVLAWCRQAGDVLTRSEHEVTM